MLGLGLDASAAREIVVRIQHHLDSADHHLESARQLLLDLKDGDGWKALGYKTWSACVKGEFGQHRSTIHRQLQAALVELDLSPNGQQLGTIPERALRELAKRDYDAEARKGIWAIANEAVGEGGKVTSGVVNVVIETIKEILVSEATDGADGVMHPLTERVHAQIVAAVREKKIAHKEHIRRMDKPRDYILGGKEAHWKEHENSTTGEDWAAVWVQLDALQLEKFNAAIRTNKPIYVSLWTEN